MARHADRGHAQRRAARAERVHPNRAPTGGQRTRAGNFEARESLFVGPSGKAVKIESHFIILEDGSRSLTAVTPFNWLRSKN
ncbi:hypothetical protein EBQ34_09720 [Vandammella animalimorsus]|uniref:Uncharacterized protein n=1 Tax=Vandammella animalimorsus TaxID=2029117 RepID=A0A3M6R944_9BURK|nr:hypothetical protein EBQ34_09720 [Vandammella animalimorsus]